MESVTVDSYRLDETLYWWLPLIVGVERYRLTWNRWLHSLGYVGSQYWREKLAVVGHDFLFEDAPCHNPASNLISINRITLSSTITNTWIGYSATFVPPLLAGGGPAVVFCLVLACFACTVLALGLAELSSAFPSSGGQYQ